MEVRNNVVELNLNDIMPNRFQPRIKFNEDSINELANSIKEHGVIQPIVVRTLGDKYEIIAGERRYKASLMAGNATIPAIIMELNDRDSAEVALLENVQRKDLTPIEEAISYKKILDMGSLTQDKLADKLGKKQSTVANKLRLLNLSDEVQEALLDDKISERHARSLLRLPSFNEQNELLDRIIAERLTVRATDEVIKRMLDADNDDDTSSGIEKIDTDNMFSNIELDAERGEKIMNNNNFNIPTNPIVDEFDTNDQGLNNQINENISPIENIVPPVEEIRHTPGQNRFFNFFGQSKTTNSENYVDDLEKTQVNMNFTDELENKNTSFPSFDFSSLPQNNQNEASPVQTDTNIFTSQPENNNQNEQANTSFPSFDFSSLPQSNSNETITANPELSTINSQSELNLNNNINPFDVNISNPSTTNLNTNMNNEIDFNSFPLDQNTPVESETSAFSPINNTSMDSEILDFDIDEPLPSAPSVNTNIEVPLPSEPIKVPEVNVMPSISVETPVVKQDNIYVAGDLKTVINTIRDCSKTIEKYGFEVETEEIDFEDKYQVIINVIKK